MPGGSTAPEQGKRLSSEQERHRRDENAQQSEHQLDVEAVLEKYVDDAGRCGESGKQTDAHADDPLPGWGKVVPPGRPPTFNAHKQGPSHVEHTDAGGRQQDLHRTDGQEQFAWQLPKMEMAGSRWNASRKPRTRAPAK